MKYYVTTSLSVKKKTVPTNTKLNLMWSRYDWNTLRGKRVENLKNCSTIGLVRMTPYSHQSLSNSFLQIYFEMEYLFDKIRERLTSLNEKCFRNGNNVEARQLIISLNLLSVVDLKKYKSSFAWERCGTDVISRSTQWQYEASGRTWDWVV